MASRSSRIQAGIPCRGSSWPERGLGLESASGSDFSEGMGGVGITGDTTGMGVGHSSTITTSSRTAGTSVTKGSIMVTSATATVISATVTSIMVASIMVADSTGPRPLTFTREHAPAHSVGLITVETSEAFPLAGGRALVVEASTEGTAVADATIDLCINNAIEWPSGGNAYVPTEGQCRYARGPSPASFDIVGQGLVIERSGASHPVRRQLGSAMAPRTPSRGPRRFARALLAGTPVEIGRAPAAPLGEAAGQRGASARLPDAVVDHGTNRRTHPEGIRSALPSRSCRSADA